MALETPAQTPNQPATTSPVTPAAPAAPPKPPERQRISTASTKIDPTTTDGTPAEKPKPAQGPDGRFVSPAPAEPAAAVPAAPAVPPAKPTRPAWLDEVALNLGFTPQEIEGTDADSLGRAVGLAQRQAARVNQQAATPAAPPPEPVVDLGLTPEQEEEFGPEAMAVFKKIALDNAKANQELRARLEQFEQKDQVRSQAQMVNTLESAVAALGDGFHGILGKGTLPDLMRSDPASYERRHFVLTSLQRQGLDFLTAPVEVIRDRIRQKTEELFPGMVKAPAPAANPNEMPTPLVGKDAWNKGGSPPPTQRTGGNELPARKGGEIEDKHRGAVTEEEIEDERIMSSLRRRQQGGQLVA